MIERKNINFAAATEADLAILQRLVDALYSEDANSSEYSRKPDISLTFEEFSKKPDKGTVFVISSATGEIIGYAITVFFWSNEFGGDVVEIDELYVIPEMRKTGVATAFFKWIQTWSSLCRGFSLQVSKQNKNAMRLYENLGFKPSSNAHLIKLNLELNC